MTIDCPHCGRVGSTEKPVPDGVKIRCPGCRQVFLYQPVREVEPAFVIDSHTEPASAPYPAHPADAISPAVARSVQAAAVAPVVQAVQVVVPEARKGNALAIASLVLGILAALVCWLPFVGLLAWPFGGLAVMLGVVGLTLAVATRRAGLAASGAGVGLGLAAIAISSLVTSRAATAIGEAAEAVGDRVRTPSQPVAKGSATPAGPLARPAGEPAKEPGPAAAPTPRGAGEATEDESWVLAPATARLGDVEVGIERVDVLPVALMRFGEEGASKDDYLIVRVSVRNTSPVRKLDYRTWAGLGFGLGRDYATLLDSHGNRYKRVTDFGVGTVPIGRVDSGSIYPGKTLTDVLVFEPPTDLATELRLELPGGNVGSAGVFRFRIAKDLFRP